MQKIALLTMCLLSLSLNASGLPYLEDSADESASMHNAFQDCDSDHSNSTEGNYLTESDYLNFSLPKKQTYSDCDLSEQGWSHSLELEESDQEDNDDYYFEEFSPQTRDALEKFCQIWDRENICKKDTKFQNQSSRTQRNEATIKHEKRKPSVCRTINPFKVTTPDLLGKHQLGKKTDSHHAPVYCKKNGPIIFHGEASKREAAFERGQMHSAKKQLSMMQQHHQRAVLTVACLMVGNQPK